jgi:hypothetical protein
MMTTGTGAANCNDAIGSNNWTNITGFVISDAQSFSQAIGSDGDTMEVEKIAITLTGELLDDPSISSFLKPTVGVDRTSRQVTSFVRVRNDTTTAAP